jgi:hypothetical protein
MGRSVAALLLASVLCAGRAEARTLRFAGRDWIAAEGPCQADNVCAAENAWVDGDGLHLRLSTAPGGGYRAASVESAEYTRYGVHRFHVRGPVADLPPNVVLGLFTFKNRPDLRDNNFIDADLIARGEGEIDVELSRWGDAASTAPNSYFTVQEGPPPAPASNVSAASFALDACSGLGCESTHEFDWEPDRIRFRSAGGASRVHEWTYPEPGRDGEAIPLERLPTIDLNLYRADADDDSPGQAVEIVVTAAELPIERVPVLSSGTASAAGFSVRYDDADGDAPVAARAIVDGKDCGMRLVDGDPAGGVYLCAASVSTGSAHGYSFAFDDGHGGEARLPAAGLYEYQPPAGR